MITLFYCLRRLPTMSIAEFSDYWFGPHAELVRNHAERLSIVRYVQHHGVAPEAALAMQSARGLDDPFDGIAEITFESFEALERANLSPEAAQAQATLANDEDQFIDRARSSIIFAQSRPVIGGAPL